MQHTPFPVIDLQATGRNILKLRQEKGLSVRDIQAYFNFEEPRAIYKWQSGQSLPSLDNLFALSALFDVPMDRIIVGAKAPSQDTIGPPAQGRPHLFIERMCQICLDRFIAWASARATRSL